MSLYDINQTILNCIKVEEGMVDTESGELFDEEAFEALKLEREKGIESLILWVKNLEADAKALKEEKLAFADRQKKTENKAKSIRAYIERLLDGKKFSTVKASATFRTTEAVEFDASFIFDVPAEYLRFAEPELQKTEVKKALKNGIAVPGCTLVKRQSMTLK